MSKIENKPDRIVQSQLCSITERDFYNISNLDFRKLLVDPLSSQQELERISFKFSKNVRDSMDRFAFGEQIAAMAKNLLYEVTKAFVNTVHR